MAGVPPSPGPPLLSDQLVAARKQLIQAQAAYSAALDTFNKATAALATAKSNVDQALAAQSAAAHNLDTLFQTFKTSPDGT